MLIKRKEYGAALARAEAAESAFTKYREAIDKFLAELDEKNYVASEAWCRLREMLQERYDDKENNR